MIHNKIENHIRIVSHARLAWSGVSEAMISLCLFDCLAMQDEENERFEILQIHEDFTFVTQRSITPIIISSKKALIYLQFHASIR